MLQQLKDWAGLVRDLGLIIGIPAMITVGVQLYELQITAVREQKAVVEERNRLLQDTQYDRARDIIRAQKELFDLERENLQKQVADTHRSSQQDQEKMAALEKKLRDLEGVSSLLNELKVGRDPNGNLTISSPSATLGVRG
jgi:uncharacterized protein YlxW (UPF0749 family)